MQSLRKKFKTRLVAATRLLPISSRYFGIPKGYYSKSYDYARSATRAGVLFFPGRDGSFRQLQAPHTFEQRSVVELQAGPVTEFATFAISIPRGRVYDASGAVLTHDDRLLVDVSPELPPAVGPKGTPDHSVFRRMWLHRCQHVPGVVAVLATAGGENYFHWITEALPRLETLRHYWPHGLESIDRFIVNRGVKAIVESLAHMGIDSRRLVHAEPGSHYAADTLVVPSVCGHSGSMPMWACDFLRRSVATALPSRGKRRIYISRAAARYRRVRNEGEVVALLGRYGFETLSFESLDFRSQVAAMTDVAIVVAPHGAGLTNILWCPSEAVVVEIFSPNYVNGCYWQMASHIGIDYWYLFGKGPHPAADSNPHLVEDDITVPLDLLERTVEAALSASA